MRNWSYDRAVRVVSTLLYLFDPDGMGASAFAPEDEYDDPARRLVAQSKDAAGLDELVRSHYAGSSDHMVGAISAVLELHLALVADPGVSPSDG